jgi:hypothetical protein
MSETLQTLEKRPLQRAGGRRREDFPPRLRRREASEYFREVWGLPLASNTLAKLAVTGEGPVFQRWGRLPVYSLADLDRYAEERLGARRRSTSEGTD